jgi:hypothetical protein
MKPMIVHPEGDASRAYLIDAHGLVATKKGEGLALNAVFLGWTKPGEFRFIEGKLVLPCPAQLGFEISLKSHDPWRSDWRIKEEAAIAMLEAAKVFKTSIDPYSSQKFKLEERTKNTEKGLESKGWDFKIAWAWSAWQVEGMKMEERWESMKRINYPHCFSAFRSCCSRMGLRKNPPKIKSAWSIPKPIPSASSGE